MHYGVDLQSVHGFVAMATYAHAKCVRDASIRWVAGFEPGKAEY